LDEALVVLHETSTKAFEERIRSLKKIENRQLAVNSIHLVTGSAFVLLIANEFPVQAKWAGAILSFSAGLVALLLPKNIAGMERQMSDDIIRLSSLNGDIARVRAEMLYSFNGEDRKMAKQIAALIGECMRLAKKYELDHLAAQIGYLPRNEPSATDEQPVA
jgi:hypothetical protein